MPDSESDRLAALRSLPLLAEADPADLERIAARIERRSFEPGTDLVSEGTTGSSIFLVAEGRCEVKKTIDGRVRRLAILSPGSFFGEMAVFSPQPRAATVTALEPVVAYVLSAWEFREALHGSFRMTMHVLRVLAERLRAVEDELAHLKAFGAGTSAGESPKRRPRRKR